MASDREIAPYTERARFTRKQKPEAVPEDEGDTASIPAFLLKAVLQWWMIATPTAILLMIASAALVLYTFRPTFRAVAQIEISDRTPYIAYETPEPLGKSEEFVQTQVELIRSPLVFRAVVSKPEVKELPDCRASGNGMAWLKKNLIIARVGHSQLYNVMFDSPNPEHAALVDNALIDEYLKLRKQNDTEQTRRVIELLEHEKTEKAGEVQKLRENMRSLTKEIVGRPPLTGSKLEESRERHSALDTLESRLTEAEVARRMLEAEIKALEESISKNDVVASEVHVELAVSESDEIRNLRKMISDKQAMLPRVASAAAQGRNDPSYRRLQREIEDYERTLERTVATTRPRVVEQVKSLSNMERKDELEKMKVKLHNARVLEDMLRDRYQTQLQSAERSGDKSLELEFTRSELSLKEKVFEMIAERSMALNTELRAPGRVSLMHRAEPPSDPVEKLPIRELALVGLASFCLPFGLAILWEHTVRRISDVHQLAPLVDMSVLGEIAHLPKSDRTQAGLFHSGRQMKLFEESINSLRVSLVLPEYMQDMKVIAVSSAIHSEGKSSISSQLAVSIARATGEPTLIIDGDMRSPDIHRIFSLANEPGLTKVLDKLCTIDDAIITDWSEYLHVLPAGKLHRSPYNLLGGSAFVDLLTHLKTKYRYIVVDTPPILSASEALVLAKAADGVLLCTRRNYSRERQVRLAHQRLIAAGANPLGAVFNAVPTSRYAYTYGDYDYSANSE